MCAATQLHLGAAKQNASAACASPGLRLVSEAELDSLRNLHSLTGRLRWVPLRDCKGASR